MKKLLITALILISTSFAFGQTFKITGFEATMQRLTDSHERFMLGQNMVVEIYDNSAIVKIADYEKIYLKKVGALRYSKSTTNSDGGETATYTLDLVKTAFVTTGAVVVWSIKQNKPPYNRASYTVTGKRF